jgi:hypothetical protein
MGFHMDAMEDEQLAAILTEDGGLPNDESFNTFLTLAREVKHVIVQNPQTELNATYGHFIIDLIHARHSLKKQLSAHLNTEGPMLEEGSLVCLIAPASYKLQ